MQRLGEFFIRHPRLIGACSNIRLAFAMDAILFMTRPFRGVFVLRLILSWILGISIAADDNDFGLQLSLIKHRSAEGPATV